MGECEYISETHPAVLKVLVRVKPGMGQGYDWVECGACSAGGRLRITSASGDDEPAAAPEWLESMSRTRRFIAPSYRLQTS